MSIYVYITRRPDPLRDSGESIDEETWQSLALSDGEFRVLTEAELAETRPGRRIPPYDVSIQSSIPGAAPISVRGQRHPSYLIWTGDPTIGPIWFMWSNGQVEIKGPPNSAIAKAMKLAPQLDARVVSELGGYSLRMEGTRGSKMAHQLPSRLHRSRPIARATASDMRNSALAA